MPAPLTTVTPPPVTPVRFGLYSTALVLSEAEGHWLNGITYPPEFLDRAAYRTTTGDATVTLTVAADGTFTAASANVLVPADGTTLTVDFGDGSDPVEVEGDGDATVAELLDAVVFTYADADTYTVTITSDYGWTATGDVIYDDGEETASVLEASKAVLAGLPPEVGAAVFPVHVLFECRPVGMAQMQQYAERVLDIHEQANIEAKFGELLAGWDGSVDVTPAGGPVTPSEGLALLERETGLRYAAQPTVHAQRDVASLLTNGGEVDRQSNRLETVLGTPVTAGAGFVFTDVGPDGEEADAGAVWLWATGPVVVRLSAKIRAQTLATAGDDGTEYDNTVRGFAERFAAITWDTLAVAVQVWADARPSEAGA